jgi:hypothetical protein
LGQGRSEAPEANITADWSNGRRNALPVKTHTAQTKNRIRRQRWTIYCRKRFARVGRETGRLSSIVRRQRHPLGDRDRIIMLSTVPELRRRLEKVPRRVPIPAAP